MKKKRKAKGIGTNSTLGLAMPSGPAKRQQFEEATRTLESYGFKTVTSRPFREYPGYLAGSIRERLKSCTHYSLILRSMQFSVYVVATGVPHFCRFSIMT